MWIAPPSGLRLRSATTTASVDFVTWSRTRADPAPWPPLTARNAFVIAIEIFAGSKPTTAPLRRISLNCAKRASTAAPPGSPTIRSRGGVGAAEEVGVVAMRMRKLLVPALWVAGVWIRRKPLVARNRGARSRAWRPRNPASAHLPKPQGRYPGAKEAPAARIYYMLCRSCVLPTKHSRRARTAQAFFPPQRGCPEDRVEWGFALGAHNDPPALAPAIHRFVHSATTCPRGRRTANRRCSFATVAAPRTVRRRRSRRSAHRVRARRRTCR